MGGVRIREGELTNRRAKSRTADHSIKHCDDGLTGGPGKSRKEGQEDQGRMKELGVGPSCYTNV